MELASEYLSGPGRSTERQRTVLGPRDDRSFGKRCYVEGVNEVKLVAAIQCELVSSVQIKTCPQGVGQWNRVNVDLCPGRVEELY